MRLQLTVILAIGLLNVLNAQSKKVARTTFVYESKAVMSAKVSEMEAVTEKEWQLMLEEGRRKLSEQKLKKKEHIEYERESDPVLQDFMPQNRGSNSPLLTFEGAQSAGYPSDATGSVDSNYYVQAVNATFSVYDKNGNRKAGPIALNTLFTGLPGATSNDGDPIVMYDEKANRWLITEMSKSGDNDYLMMAVSQTSNPLGAWYSYSFDVDDWPDYPKYGIWRDGYYIGIDKIGNNTQDQEDVFAVERDKMLLGKSARMVGFINPDRPNVTYSIAAPIDNEGDFAAAGSPALFTAICDAQWGVKDQLWIYEMDVDWNNISNSTFSRIQALDVASFTPASDPVQPGGYSLDGLASYIMNKPVYRNFSTANFNYQTIVCCHNVDGSSGVGIRWYELIKTDGDWEIYQQGTYSPDSDDRWVGSISMNSNQRIALGYSITGSSTYPGIRYAAQSPSAHAAANGTLDIAEETIYSGSVLQSSSHRWGDYSNISVDPSNDSVFWYTNQYVAATPKTKVSKFKFGPYGLTADFIANTVETEVNVTIKLNDISYGNPSTWSWSFSPSTVTYTGGTSSSSQNPWVQFTSPGTYSVTLIIGDGSTNDTLTRTSYINITSSCTVSTFPWTEGFENSGSIPTCWSQVYDNIYNEDWQFVTGDDGFTGLHNSAHSGTYNAFFQKNSALTSLVLPKFDLSSLTTPQLDFWYIQDGNSTGYDEFSVLYKAAENASWITLKTYQVKKTSWTHDTIVLPNNTSQSYIAFKSGPSYGGYGVLIDDVKIEESGVACAPPQGPVSNPSGTTAVVSWLNQLSSPTWEVEYGPEGFAQGTGTSVTGLTDTTYTITGLTVSTNYDWYVRKNCGGTPTVYSSWTGLNTFTTTTVPFTLPVSEDFESGFVKFVNPSGNDVDFVSNTSLKHGGSKSAYNNYSDLNSNYLEMASYVDLSSASYPVLSFWHIAKINNDGDFCKVQISTDNGSSWVTLPTKYYGGSATNYSAYQRFDENSYGTWSGTPADNTWWKKEVYALDTYKYKKVKIRFYITSNVGGVDEGWYIDDILLEDNACPGIYPDSLWTQNITATTAKFKWTEKGNATVWDIEYGATGFSQGTGTSVIGVTTNPFSVTGLSASSTYDWYVRSSCGSGNFSEWSGPETFSTPCSPVSLPYFESFEGITAPAMPQCYKEDDANNDGTDWGSNIFSSFSGSQSAGVGTPSDRASDDWFFTPGFSMQAGVSYELAFVYTTVGGGESLEVKYGDYPSVESMNLTPIWSNNNITSWSYELATVDITPPSTAVYYFGFHANSKIGTGGIDVDDIYVNVNSASATWTGSSSNDWYTVANWGNDTLPTALTDVNISATASNYPTLTKLSLAKNLTLKSSASGNASLMGEGFLRSSANLNVEQYLTAGKWHLLSSPVDTSTTSDLYFNHNPDVWLKSYDEPTDTWTFISTLDTYMPAGAGYAVWVEAGTDTIATFSGNFTSSDVYLDGVFSIPTLNFTSSAHGYNLVGNPFPSALDWDLSGWDTTNIEGSIWIWDQAITNYVYRNAQGQGSLTDGIIPRGQGFFIRAKSNNMYFTIPTSARVHSNQGFYKKPTLNDTPYAIVRCIKDDMEDEVWISFTDDASFEYDNGFDVGKLFSNGEAPEMYLHENEIDLSVLSWPGLEGDTRIAHLYFKAGKNGNQKLVLHETANMEDYDIMLEDLKTNTIIDFKKEAVYYFDASTYQSPDRFRLHFTNYITAINDDEPLGNSVIYANDNMIYVKLNKTDEDAIAHVEVFDLFGRKVQSVSSKNQLIRINVTGHNKYYIVKLAINKKLKVRKVFVR
ncbi:MAG: hypothetical protein GXO88_05440 [Chlorobi bacterium]|nr:hypothetical protein [Chlorobiota bacterium]